MPWEVSLNHITGSRKVIKNNFFSDEVGPSQPNRRTIGQMFFQPYESRKEFIHCARHTTNASVFVGLAIFDPTILITTPLIMCGLAVVGLVVNDISKLCGDYSTAAFAMDFANAMYTDLAQLTLDILVLPLSILMMATRGISTGLQATGIYDYENPSAAPSYPASSYS